MGTRSGTVKPASAVFQKDEACRARHSSGDHCVGPEFGSHVPGYNRRKRFEKQGEEWAVG